MARPLTALALLPPFFFPLASCSTPDLSVDAGYMVMEMAGDLGFDGSGGGGSVGINLGQGLDINNADSPYAKLETQVLGMRVGLSGFSYSDSGDSTLDASFGDIAAGSTVSTDIDLLNIKGTVSYDLLNLGFLRVSPGVGVDYFDMNLKMVATAPVAANEKLDFQVPVPMAYVSTELKYEMFSLDTDIGGMSVDLPDAKGTFWDVTTKVKYHPLPLVDVFVGYRYLMINADGTMDGQDFNANLHMNGLFFGGRVAF